MCCPDSSVSPILWPPSFSDTWSLTIVPVVSECVNGLRGVMSLLSVLLLNARLVDPSVPQQVAAQVQRLVVDTSDYLSQPLADRAIEKVSLYQIIDYLSPTIISLTSPWSQSDLTLTSLWPYLDLTLTLPWPHSDLTLTSLWPFLNLCLTLTWPHSDLTLISLWPHLALSLTSPWPQSYLTLTSLWPYLDLTLTLPWPHYDLS